MHGSFVVAKGVLTNQDLAIAGPVLSMTGAGEVDIGNRALDLRLVPRAQAKGVSVGIPFRVSGSWDRVHYKPELSGIVGGMIQNLESGKAPFKGLFGNGQKKQDQGGQPQNQPKKKKKSAGARATVTLSRWGCFFLVRSTGICGAVKINIIAAAADHPSSDFNNALIFPECRSSTRMCGDNDHYGRCDCR